jgi:hypothetical protein
VRKLVSLTLASSAVVAMACGSSKKANSVAMSADLQRDLQLATASQNVQINPDEVAPQSKQELSLRPKAAPHAPKVVRTQHPTVKASPEPAQVAEVKTEVPQVEVMASNPAPTQEQAPDSPPLARPSPMPAPSTPSNGNATGRGTGNSDGGVGVGGVLGGIFGAVIRGGMIGDDDHCDPRPRGRANPGDIYGRPGSVGIPGGMGGIGGMGRARFPFMVGRPR